MIKRALTMKNVFSMNTRSLLFKNSFTNCSAISKPFSTKKNNPPTKSNYKATKPTPPSKTKSKSKKISESEEEETTSSDFEETTKASRVPVRNVKQSAKERKPSATKKGKKEEESTTTTTSSEPEEEPVKKKTPARKEKSVPMKQTKKAPQQPKKKKEETTTTEEENLDDEELKIEETKPASKTSKKPVKAVHTMQTSPTTSKQETEKPSEEQTSKQPAKKVMKKSLKPNLADPNSLGIIAYDTPISGNLYTTSPNGFYENYVEHKSSPKTKDAINLERQYLCRNYDPLPVICSSGEGVYLTDVDGITYMDFLSAYSAVNHGHNNKFIIEHAIKQMNQLYMTSRAFYNNKLGEAGKMLAQTFKYDKVLFMNTGVEAGETAVKLARRWGYDVKKIPNDEAKIVFAKGNFWGRTTYACATSDDPSRYERFGPLDRSAHYMIEYNNISELENLLNSDSNICGVFLEPIQGENGVVIPDAGYLKTVSELCKKYNVLFIADEIQTGMGRTGYPTYCDTESILPDVLLLGKSLAGGLYPVSAVLANKNVMDVIGPGEHGSTFGGNPLGVSIVTAAISEMIQKNLYGNAFYRGIELGSCLRELANNPLVKEVRGRGLMFAIELWPDCGVNAYDFSLWLMERGLLCKPTRINILR